MISKPTHTPGLLPFPPVADLWNQLKWKAARPEMEDFKTRPVRFPDVPATAGLYRVCIIDSMWSSKTSKRIMVQATNRVNDPWLDTGSWKHPVILTLGKTTQLSARLEQHLGNNSKNNRLLRRLRHLFPNNSDDQIRRSCTECFKFEFVECPDWRLRFLLENYGTALHQSILDFSAEH